MSGELSRLIVLVKGGGEVASGVAHKLARAHLRVCITETAQPLAVSRGVAFCEAVYDGEKEVEGVVAQLADSVAEVHRLWREGRIPVIVDPGTSVRKVIKPDVVVDAIMAKKNLGTRAGDAPLVIGLGPGFRAGKDVHMVVETNNSERLGRVILKGEAEKDTGVPVEIEGFTGERALHASRDGLFQADREIGEMVSAGEVVAAVNGEPVKAEISGVVRAMLRSGIKIKKGTKLGEIDPSGDREAIYTIRPRVRAIAGGALEAIMMHYNV